MSELICYAAFWNSFAEPTGQPRRPSDVPDCCAVLVRAQILLAAVLVGVLTVGVLSRLLMFGLIRMNPDADGTVTDDGFEMGRFTLSGSLNLVLVGAIFGLLSGVLYLVLEPLLIGPDWFRTLSLSVGAGVVAATQLVHADGVDFHVLDPYWVAVAAFVVLPVGHVALVDRAGGRLRRAAGRPAPRAPAALGWVLRAGLAVLFVVALASLASDVSTLADLNR